jgi:riboflavin kinase / FMN adenylyltransferase
MEIINNLDQLPPGINNLYLALGNFDGIHRGHQAILKEAVKQARAAEGVSAALIFNPHPLNMLRNDKPVSLLTDLADRAEIMAELGVDYLIIEPFSKQFASLEPEQFVKQILVEKLRVRGVFVGENYRFGRLGAGNPQTLSECSKRMGFVTLVQPLLTYNKSIVSSSLIRKLLVEGSVREAAEYLNYYFYREGRVCRGSGLGHRLVYPTANLVADGNLLWPGNGVYLTAIGKISDHIHYGVTNVGPKPTFNHYSDRFAETHILDFNSSIYGKNIRLCFLERLRETKFFTSPQILKEQIRKDIQKARDLLISLQEEITASALSLQAGCSVLRSP